MHTARWRLAVVVAAIVVVTICGRLIDVRQLAGDVKGDEATYIAMAFSLADDGDLKWEREDYTRFAALYDRGPDGIFLKRAYDVAGDTPVPVDRYVAFGKALAYPVAAAPFVRL